MFQQKNPQLTNFLVLNFQCFFEKSRQLTEENPKFYLYFDSNEAGMKKYANRFEVGFKIHWPRSFVQKSKRFK